MNRTQYEEFEKEKYQNIKKGYYTSFVCPCGKRIKVEANNRYFSRHVKSNKHVNYCLNLNDENMI
jgi:hypothetical protein